MEPPVNTQPQELCVSKNPAWRGGTHRGPEIRRDWSQGLGEPDAQKRARYPEDGEERTGIQGEAGASCRRASQKDLGLLCPSCGYGHWELEERMGGC